MHDAQWRDAGGGERRGEDEDQVDESVSKISVDDEFRHFVSPEVDCVVVVVVSAALIAGFRSGVVSDRKIGSVEAIK
ncbi:MAG: hypothetical protein CMN75_14615 [Spirochaeta sp.]|nr:hypothetical protein [Spirochaeta sp.]